MANFPNQDSASGIWSLNSVRNANMGEVWPGPTAPPITVEALFVAGGGGSGGSYTSDNAVGAGGAGGGGVVVAKFDVYSGNTYNIAVGAGGAARGFNQTGNNGNDTYLDYDGFQPYFRAKGGGGGGYYEPGFDGGSGGASGYGGGAGGETTQALDEFIGKNLGSYISDPYIRVDSAAQYGSDAYQGAAPGTGTGTPGGGGATQVGQEWDGFTGGDGGDGYTWFMDSATYGGGGGGTGKYNAAGSQGGIGGTGGGGDGATAVGGAGTDGTDGLGGGGGGGVGTGAGGDGGSGVAILYATEPFTNTTGTPAETTVAVTHNGVLYTRKYVFSGDGSITV